MARGYLNEKEYRLTDLEKYIRKLMSQRQLTGKEIAEKLGHTQSWYSKRLTTGSWTFGELLDLFQILKPEPEKIGRMLIL